LPYAKPGAELPDPKAPGPRPASGRRERRRQAHGRVSPSEGKRSAATRTQGVGAPHSTKEPGEPYPKESWRGKGVPHHGIVGGKHDECIETRGHVNVTTTNSRAGEASPAEGIMLTCGHFYGFWCGTGIPSC